MSFTKQTLESFAKSINDIFQETYNDNDITHILINLNTIIDISEKFIAKDSELEFYWNEIVSDIISVIYCGLTGQYRVAISGLRNTLELVCSAFYYYDHRVELKLFVSENFKADKYVSMLIGEHHFFKTNYIRTFNDKIDSFQLRDDSVSSFLLTTYGKLCDVVHGRYNSLTKKEKLSIEYSKSYFKRFEKAYICTLSAIATLYVFRFNDFSCSDINQLALKSKTFNIPK